MTTFGLCAQDLGSSPTVKEGYCDLRSTGRYHLAVASGVRSLIGVDALRTHPLPRGGIDPF
jgi:hypothetical protein